MTKDWERAAFFLWCAQVRLQFERSLFPPTDKGGDSPTLPLFAVSQRAAQSYLPMLYTFPDAHRRVVERLNGYVPDVDVGYHPLWNYSFGVTKSEAQTTARKLVTTLAESSARILELTAIPEYLESLKIYADAWDESPERASRFRAANETMWRIESEKQIKSGLASRPRRNTNP